MKEQLKRRRIFYVPGMISLVLIPLLFIIYFFKTDSFKVQGGIELSLADKSQFKDYKVPTLRDYKQFNLYGSEFSERKQLNEIKLYLRKLIVNKYTVNGINVHYNSKTNYDVFIRTIDILIAEESIFWTIHNNDVYVLIANTARKEAKNERVSHSMNCGTMQVMGQLAILRLKNKKEEEERVLKAVFFKEKWIPISLGYLGIVLLNIFALVKFNKNKY